MGLRRSVRRIIVRSLLLGVPVIGMIAAVMLPRFLKLDTYRPAIQEQLQQATGRRVTLGYLQARLLPPGLLAESMTAFEMDPPHRPVVTADRVRLRLRFLPLLKGKIIVHTIALDRPRVILYADRLSAPRAVHPLRSGTGPHTPPHVLIHQGRVELDGPQFGQTERWAVDNVEARVEGARRVVTVSARPSFLGSRARLTATLDPSAAKPARADIRNASLDAFFSILGSTQAARWRGATLSASAEALWPVLQGIDVRISRMTLPPVPGAFVDGSLFISTATVRSHLDFHGLTSSMTVTARWRPRGKGWELKAQADRYSPEITRALQSDYWINAIDGPGTMAFTAVQAGSHPLQFSLVGSSFTFTGTRMQVPAWSATETGRLFEVRVNAQTPEADGHVEVLYSRRAAEPFGTVSVSLSSITVGDVIYVLGGRPATPIGVEPWLIKEGWYESPVTPQGSLDIRRGSLELEHFVVETNGWIELNRTPPQARFQGHLKGLKLKPVVESFGVTPSPITGLADGRFDLRFDADPLWMKSLNGRVEVSAANGFLRAGKLMYRVAGLLNLTNLIKPAERTKTSADGIPFRVATATATFTDGVLDTRDLKVRTENMTIAAKGQINLPAKTIDAGIEFQFMRFVKDALAAIPLVKRIVTPDSGLVRVPVSLKGPLEDPEIQ